MEQEKHKDILTAILAAATSGDQATISEKLTELADDYGVTLAEKTLAQQQAEDLKRQNAELSAVNMRLFLRVGEKALDGSGEGEADDDKPAPKFDDLVDENGRLK